VPKNTDRHPLKSKVETLDTARLTTPDLLPPPGTFDRSTVATVTENGTVREIKEWQAIMDHLRGLPVRNAGELPVIPVDARAAEVRAFKASRTSAEAPGLPGSTSALPSTLTWNVDADYFP
jgi:5'-nucleotidase/UDP-sugar diphosphatase